MALQPLPRLRNGIVPAGRLVVGHRDSAVLALNLLSAAPAHHHGRISAAIQQQDHLLATINRELSLLNQLPRKNMFLPGLTKLRTHIYQFHGGQWPLHHALPYLDTHVSSLVCIGPVLKRRRRRTKHHNRFVELGTHHRNVAPVIARRLLLLVARVMFLIHNDQAQIDHRRKHGRPRPDDDSRLAAANPVPLLCALVGRQLRMQHRYLALKRRIHLSRHRGRQANLRDQQQRRFTRV